MRIFITGGAGFIGTHLCKKLSALHKVTVYDNFSNSNQNDFFTPPNVKLVVGDILDDSKLSNSMKNHDIVIHLAAKTDVVDSIDNPDDTFETNIHGTQNVLDSCVQNSIKRIISTSSAAVYSNSEMISSEESNTEPISPYGISKLSMEKIIIDSKIDSVILRLFNVYGNGNSSGVIANFKENILHNQPLTIFGDGKAIRDFIHVNDVINGIILSLSSQLGLYNIASGIETSIICLAKLCLEISASKSEIIFKSARDEEIIFSVADVSLSKKTLKFTPLISLKSGLEQFFS